MPLSKNFPNIPGVLIDATDQAASLQLEAQVGITTSAANRLRPSSYLRCLGFNLEQRIINLLMLVQGRLKADKAEERFNVNLCLAHGPIIQEKLSTFVVLVTRSDDGDTTILITSPFNETDERKFA